MPNNNSLVIPFRIEALFLDSDDANFAGRSLDYTQLPYYNGKTDADGNPVIVNPGNPFIGDTVSERAFAVGANRMPHGLHLHFILPQFLGRSVPKRCAEFVPKGQTTPTALTSGRIPAAPNRWLVKKTNANAVSYVIIQSDYIYPDTFTVNDFNNFQAVIGHKFSKSGETHKPYACIGRCSPFFLNDTTKNQYISWGGGIPSTDGHASFKSLQGHPLTTMGIGDHHFSSYYPNCSSVFGVHDSDIIHAGDLSENLIYEVFGWHDDKTDDTLFQFINTLITNHQDNIVEQLQTNFSIEFDQKQFDKNSVSPCIYYSKKVIDSKPADANYANVRVTVGKSVNEAVSAYLANELAVALSKDKTLLEEQIESVSLFRSIEHLNTDILPKLKEARHTQGFRKVDGGTKWVLKRIENHTTLNTPNTTNDSNTPTTADKDVELPLKYLDWLNDLNQSQLVYDDAVNEIISLKEQIFNDYINCLKASGEITTFKRDTPNYDQAELDRLLEKKYLYKNLSNKFLIKDYNDAYTNLGGVVSVTDGVLSAANAANPRSLAAKLYTNWHTIAAALKDDKLSQSWSLTPVPNQAYWQPKAPAVLISGLPDDGSEDALVKLNPNKFLKVFISDLDSNNSSTIISNIIGMGAGTSLFQCNSADNRFESFWGKLAKILNYSNQVSAPFILDWQTQLDVNYPDPTKVAGPTMDFDGSYLPHYSNGSSGLDLKEDDCEFSYVISGQTVDPNLEKKSITITGNSILSHSGRKGLLSQMMLYLDAFLKKNGKQISIQNEADLLEINKNIDEESKVYAVLVYSFHNHDFNKFKGFVAQAFGHLSLISLPINQVVINVIQKIVNNNFIAQTLSGFNHSCRQRKITAQLPVTNGIDPFNPDFDLTNIYNALNPKYKDGIVYEKSSPKGDADVFLPIILGEISFPNLTIIDNFGNHHSIPTSGIDNTIPVNYSESMLHQASDTQATGNLYPRFSQAARLDFEWLDANKNPLRAPAPDSKNVYDSTIYNTCKFSNSLEASSPICGWLVPNYFNGELMVFDAAGQALGYLDDGAKWKTPPFAKVKTDIDLNIQNEHLNRIVKWIMNDPPADPKADPTRLQQFLNCVEYAADHSLPNHRHHFNSKALLMGHPIAVVRAAARVHIKGLPALNQDRDLYYKYLQTQNETHIRLADYLKTHPITYKDRLRNSWDKISIYLRIGEFSQLGDGLYGYWNDRFKEVFYTNQPTPDRSTPEENGPICLINSNKPGLLGLQNMEFFTMLIDPRSCVHATTGILPTVNISLDPGHFEKAIKNISMWFKVSPLLQPTKSLSETAQVNLPKVPGFQWQVYDQFNGLRNIQKDELDTLTLSENTLTESFLILK